MPISVKAVGKPSMMATTINASMSSPMWPLVMLPQGMSTRIAITMIAISEKPNHSSLRNFICLPLVWGIHKGVLAPWFELSLVRFLLHDELIQFLDVLVLDMD